MPDCNSCREYGQTVPAIVHDADMDRQQEDKKRLWIVIVILILALLISNTAWVIYESQFEEVTTSTMEEYEVSAEGDGIAVINDSGVVHVGEGETYSNNYN